MDYSNKEKVISVNNLVVDFKTDHGVLHAVRDVSFDLYKGETLCIVGESGSGKSVTSKTIMGILAHNAMIKGGSIIYRGENLLEVSEDEFYKIRGHKIGMIFQDPLSSLNPIVKIGQQITEAMLINNNKLKIMYDDLISDELIAYKNVFARRNIAINGLTDRLSVLKVELNKNIDTLTMKLDEIKASNIENKQEQIAAIKGEIKKIKEEYKLNKKNISIENKQKIKEIKVNATKEALPLKEKLNVKKAEAKKEVIAFKEKQVATHKDNLNTLSNKLNAQEITNSEYKKLVKEEQYRFTNEFKITKSEAKRRALEVMKEVGIPEPEKRFKQYPFEFSGGMRQRIVIAIALTASPEILICDEPTTALDVTIQAQILELINRIKAERNLSCIFITHDLGVVANMADRVAVMYAGKIVEYGLDNEIFYDPKHPYTWALLSSIPDVDSKEKLDAIPGTPPNMIYPPKGDAFALRSKYAMQIDFEEEPPYFKVSETHYAATWLLDPRAPKVEMPKIVQERIKLNKMNHNK